ncbi:MAG: hypothetical protein FWF45_04540 [Coriobacteriia bacterium]|nr:hypothetical protein [Coriobacteriia bacterium]
MTKKSTLVACVSESRGWCDPGDADKQNGLLRLRRNGRRTSSREQETGLTGTARGAAPKTWAKRASAMVAAANKGGTAGIHLVP